MYSKNVLLSCFGLFFLIQPIIAQSKDDVAIKEVISAFFEGLHAVDTLKIKEATVGNVIMHTIGKSGLKSASFSDFLKNIAAINPETTKIEEKLLSYEIKVDNNMANVWTAYEFYVNAELSHFGVNSFQLFKDDGKWKIFYIVDTRRKENCNK